MISGENSHQFLFPIVVWICLNRSGVLCVKLGLDWSFGGRGRVYWPITAFPVFQTPVPFTNARTTNCISRFAVFSWYSLAKGFPGWLSSLAGTSPIARSPHPFVQYVPYFSKDRWCDSYHIHMSIYPLHKFHSDLLAYLSSCLSYSSQFFWNQRNRKLCIHLHSL